MSTGTGIEWTDATWNPVVGCTKVSEGCRNCYAETMSNRLAGMAVADIKTEGEREPGRKLRHLAVINPKTGGWNGKVGLIPEALSEPLKWKKPRRVFVCSMSDLFHKDVPFDYIDRVFAVMALCPRHTFQVLTKRPERMAEYLERPWLEDGDRWLRAVGHLPAKCLDMPMSDIRYPLENVWLGTSCEDHEAADERVPHLLRCPAAVRFLSCEPLLGAIDLTRVNFGVPGYQNVLDCRVSALAQKAGIDKLNGIDWVIVGGESGAKARACDVAWVRSIVKQCAAAGVACFVKQLGKYQRLDDEEYLRCRACGEWTTVEGCDVLGGSPAKVKAGGEIVREDELFCQRCSASSYRDGPQTLKDAKGGDMAEWPEDLRVRQMPGGEA